MVAFIIGNQLFAWFFLIYLCCAIRKISVSIFLIAWYRRESLTPIPDPSNQNPLNLK